MSLTRPPFYDNPAYQAVLFVPLNGTSTLAGGGLNATMPALASGQTQKFVAFTNMLVKSCTTAATTIGTGTSTAFVLGNVGTGNAGALVRITANGTTQLTTCTGTYQLIGNYILPQGATAITTAAQLMNWTVNTAYSTAIGTSAASVNAVTGVNNWTLINGAIPLLPGDTINFVKGIDGTEVLAAPVLEVQILPS